MIQWKQTFIQKEAAWSRGQGPFMGQRKPVLYALKKREVSRLGFNSCSIQHLAVMLWSTKSQREQTSDIMSQKTFESGGGDPLLGSKLQAWILAFNCDKIVTFI